LVVEQPIVSKNIYLYEFAKENKKNYASSTMGKPAVCVCFKRTAKGIKRTADFCTAKGLCHALLIARTAKALCLASQMVHDKIKVLTVGRYKRRGRACLCHVPQNKTHGKDWGLCRALPPRRTANIFKKNKQKSQSPYLVAQVEMLALIVVYTEKKNEPLQHVSHKL
jgi:hypothetical protein